jgi:hypothetical protein
MWAAKISGGGVVCFLRIVMHMPDYTVSHPEKLYYEGKREGRIEITGI